MGLQTQGLLLIITTAGFLLNGPCHKEYDYCKKILSESVENDEYFVYIAELDKDDDIKLPKNWYKANPLMYQVPRMMSYLKGELKAALEDLDKMRNFMTKNMNVWVDFKAFGYMEMERWKACGVDILPDLTGKECFIGYDLSAKIDLTSVAFEFEIEMKNEDGEIVPGYVVLSHSFMPEETVERKRKTDKVPYDMWVKQGWITITPGAVVDYRFVKKYAQDRAIENGWITKEHCLDPWGAVQISADLLDEGEMVVEIIQGMRTLSGPTKDFRDQVYSKRVIHEKNPVLTWAMSNAITREDHNKNFMLDKSKSVERIDPVAALMNAHVRAMVNEPIKRSIYEERTSFRL